MTTSPRVLAAVALAAALAALAACGDPVVEVEPVPADYTTWYRVDATGALPGHGDTYRIIYVNDVLRDRFGTGEAPDGSIVVKEIRELADGGGPGDLSYIAVMRRLPEPPPGGALDGGWLFTYLGDGIDGDETNPVTCWATCHVAAPYEGLFLTYGRP